MCCDQVYDAYHRKVVWDNGGVMISRETSMKLGNKTGPVPLCLPEIHMQYTIDGTQAATVRSQHLTI